ncbi:hypothetical protein PGTUg99_016555 [Puccinia graminis f. sp. tritici]|uniref:Uncharacterized protein n=1 Tax=Puccinia graminis f. sp. tritici TaxID=56615 RepID=A0A5B0SIF3_PUCGR|nr:hypothetical protein PGTUg99_016555 [Puccinia graminis f. sp. tritici]
MAQSVVEEQQEESLHHNLRNILAKLNINTVEEFFGLEKKPKSSQATHSNHSKQVQSKTMPNPTKTFVISSKRNSRTTHSYTTGAARRLVDLAQKRSSNVVPFRRGQRSDAVRNYIERCGWCGWGSDNVLTTLSE